MIIDFKNVSIQGVESSPHATALAGLRANEARYIFNKYKQNFETFSVSEKPELMEDINKILKTEREIVFSAKPLEIAQLLVEEEGEKILWTWVFYEDGLSINVLYNLDDPKRRAVGLKLSDGMDVPSELVDRFKFARMKSKLAGTIRGSYFVIKGNYDELMKKWLSNMGQ